jgi:signal transduction histidine kinase
LIHAPLRVLLVEDNPGDEGLLRAALEDVPGAHCDLLWAPTLDEALARLQSERFDALLLDLDLGPTRGLATLALVSQQAVPLPIVVLTGRDDVTTGVGAVQAGAQDYLIKGRADGDQIWRALCYAVERHRAEQTIRTLNETLEHRVDLRTRELMLANEEMLAFVRACAHDLRGPLRTVEGLVSLVITEHGPGMPEDAVELLDRTRRAVVRQDAILTALTRFARAASAQLDLQTTDLVPPVRAMVAEYVRRHPERTVKLECPDHVVVTADPAILHVALENLVSNALKFSHGRDVAVLEFGIQGDRRPPVVFLRDNGVGFEPAYTHKLFKPFQRLHDERVFAGTGLGLTTVQRVVRLHGGRVWAEAEPDRGATFYFTLAPEAVGARPPAHLELDA